MDEVIAKLAVALIGALLTWLATRYYNRSRLYCAPSRLYEYSSLFDGSSTVQLLIANRGRKSEEAVEVQLSPEYEYHLLAATQSGVEIPKEKAVRIPVLLPKSEVSMIFVAEGRPRFSKDGIRHIRSKNSKGRVGASLTETEASSPGAVPATVALLLIVAVLGYGLGRTIGEDAWRSCRIRYRGEARAPSDDELSEEHLKAFAADAVAVKHVATQGDSLLVDVEIENIIEGPINYSITLLSHASDSTTEWGLRSNKQVYNIVMLDKGERRKYSLSDYFPADRAPKRFWLEARVELFGYWVTVKRSYFFSTDASMSCSSNAT